MAFRSVSKTRRHSTSLECDPDPSNPTVFHYRALSARELAEAKDRATHVFQRDGETAVEFRGNVSAIEVCKRALLGWDNMVGDDGQAIEFNLDKAGQMVDHLHLDAARELAQKIESASTLSVEEGKG